MNNTVLIWMPLSLIFIIVIALWLSLSLLLNRTGNHYSNRLLGAFLFTQTIPLANVYSSVQYGTNEWSWIITSNLTWLYGPFLLAFCRAITDHRFSFPQITKHFIPFFITLVFRYLPWSPDALPLFIIAPLFIQLSLYIYWSAKCLLLNKEKINSIVHSTSKTHFYWLLYLIVGIFIMIMLDIFFITKSYLFSPMNNDDWFIYIVALSLFLQGIIICSLVKPNIFFEHYQQVLTNASINNNRELKTLDRQLAESLSLQLQKKMNEQELYLNNELTLKDLAEHLGINSHQISELLNVHLKQTFYEYINRYRLDKAKTMLKDGNVKASILDIAFESGFNNKNSFYRAFKQDTGLTPKAFQRTN
ncbi:helix-turn-helix domain-containing protein [Thalassotalea sediminis]|uniref:helix-turn-helix domain-containing protein n=1 Tax=Thalassotalea sediminis TaxID=1759089 RepID=UPI0025726872|nr:helix-turn-helix transcriptional regulator [Thalassotalea sediminis]